jgi:hypothetical protein
LSRGNMNTRIIRLAALCFVLACLRAGAQSFSGYDEIAEREFSRALERFENSDYRGAAELFESLATRQAPHQRSTAAQVMAARSLFHLSEYQRCIALLRAFLDRYPRSTYTRIAYELLADAYRRTGDDYLALRAFVHAFLLSRDSADRDANLDDIGAVCQSGLRLPTLLNALEEFRGNDIYALVLMSWAESAWDAGERDAGLEAFRALPQVVGDTGWAARHAQLAQKFGVPIHSVSLGIVLPSPHDMLTAKEIRDFKDGVLTAVEEFRGSRPLPIEVSVGYAPSNDSLRGLVDALANDASLVGIIGGIYHADAAVLARAAGRRAVPCLIAALLPDSLPSASPTVFQLGATARTRGELLARHVTAAYAGWRTAVLAPLDSPARDIASGFIDAMKRAGRSPAVVSWYAPGASDLRSQFKTIADQLAGDDSLAILFVPVSSSDAIPVVLSGYQASGLRSLIVGAGEWDHPELLNRERLMRCPVYFESDYYIAGKDSTFRHFEYAYLVQSQRLASRHAVLGYDAAAFFLSALSSGSLRREDVVARLRTVYHGLRGPIAFPGRQINQGVTIFRYEDRSVYRHTIITGE